MTKIIKKTSENTHIIISKDINSQIDVSQPREEGEFRDSNIGKCGLHNVDLKGSQLINFVRDDDLDVANTFFKPSTYKTYKSFNNQGTVCQIDHVLVNKTMNALIENYQVDYVTATSSDQSALDNFQLKHSLLY